ncbi:MAG TPA: hypothetical protein PK134_05270, partial [Bacteroidia bacterium]|nr:hypothetical protein [Bacteroidia bacterium]
CATDQAVYFIDKSDNSVQRYSKINGLSDVGIRLMDYSHTENVVFVGYVNSNIDLISSTGIINISDVERRTATGDK